VQLHHREINLIKIGRGLWDLEPVKNFHRDQFIFFNACIYIVIIYGNNRKGYNVTLVYYCHSLSLDRYL